VSLRYPPSPSLCLALFVHQIHRSTDWLYGSGAPATHKNFGVAHDGRCGRVDLDHRRIAWLLGVQAVPCGARVQGSSCSARSFASRPWSAISVPSYLALGLVEGMGLPLDIVSAGSPRHDSPLLLLALAGLEGRVTQLYRARYRALRPRVRQRAIPHPLPLVDPPLPHLARPQVAPIAAHCYSAGAAASGAGSGWRIILPRSTS
jgi:hypothetical protein